MSRLNEQLGSWAATELKYWEQAALDKIARHPHIGNEEINQLVQYFLEDAGLSPLGGERPKPALLERVVTTAVPASCRLSRILNVQGVNALAGGQEIRFGPQVTVLYGTNGAGKSGYARALGSAGFARGKREVLPNAVAAEQRNRPQADIELDYGSTNLIVTWTEGKRCRELAGFYLFDGGSLVAHLNDPNSLSFTPGGLEILTQLSEVTDLVRDRVRALIEKNDVPNNFEGFFEGESETKNQIRQIHAHSKIDDLEKLATLTPEELATIAKLETEIAQLRLTNIAKQVETKSRELRDLEGLIKSIGATEHLLGESVLIGVNQAIVDLRNRRGTLEHSGAEQFSSASFSQAGSEKWREFVVSAKTLADIEASRGSPYPASGDHCLLCRQSLSGDAITHIQKLWAFLQSDAQFAVMQAEARCAYRAREIERVDVNYFAPGGSARRILEDNLAMIVPSFDAQVEACRERRAEMLQGLTMAEPCAPPPLINLDTTEIRNLVGIWKEDLNQLRASDASHRLTQLERHLRKLRHRQILAGQIPEVKRYIEKRKWALRARESLGSTRTITAKYNELFNELVSERYRMVFEETLRKFRPDINVTIETRGFKGETVRQLVLNPKVFRAGFSIEQILSEGEKRAVAVADFLTEAVLDQRNNGIILDDPVTSLDDNWKNTLAVCLADVAKTRQVVVLTHDLAFLYRLKERCEEIQVDVTTHWIREESGRPGYVYLDSSPVCEKDYKSARIATEYYTKAKDARPVEQQLLLQQGFGALRTCYEALIVFDLFNDVVARFEERLSFGRLKDVRVDPRLVEEIIRRMETLSRYIEGHLHSDRFASTKPSPTTLLDEIRAFEIIRSTQRDLRKPVAQASSRKPDTAISEQQRSLASAEKTGAPPNHEPNAGAGSG